MRADMKDDADQGTAGDEGGFSELGKAAAASRSISSPLISMRFSRSLFTLTVRSFDVNMWKT
jgi:hypothetical protein